MVAHALRAREDHVVVGHDHAAPAVDLADAADEPVGGRARDQLLARAPALLRGEQQRPVLDERAVVDEVGEVLARGALAALVAARDRVRARRRRGRSRGARARRAGRRALRRRAARRPLTWASRGASRGSSVSSSWPSSTASPTATASARTTPSASASTSCSIFIASSTTSGVPAATCASGGVRDRDDDRGERRGQRVLGVRGHRGIIADGDRERRAAYGGEHCPPAPARLRAKQLPSRAMSSAEHQQTPAERREVLKELLARARSCERCPELAATRKTVVFGAGNADAELMFIGEAPGASEDEQGVPFVGRAGKLLEKLLDEIGLLRTDVFIANTLKCRPPGNRDPLPSEIENCQDYLLQPGRADPADGDLHARQLLDEAAARRSDGDHAPARPGARCSCSARARCACTRSSIRRPRCTRRGCSRRCARTSRACPRCSRSGRPSSRRRRQIAASAAPVPEPQPEPLPRAAAAGGVLSGPIRARSARSVLDTCPAQHSQQNRDILQKNENYSTGPQVGRKGCR